MHTTRLSVVMGVLTLLAGCGPQDPNRIPRVNLITGSTGSDWHRIGSAVAFHTNAAFNGQPVTAIPGAGGISNPARVGMMPGDFGVSFLAFLRLAYDGAEPYTRAFRDLRHVASLITNKLHLIVNAALPIESLADIKAKRLRVRIGTGPPGSGEELLLRESLLAYDMTYDDIRAWGGRVDLLGSAERADLFRDDHIDLIAFNSNAPSAVITELMLSHSGRFLGLPDEVRRRLNDRWRVLPVPLPAGTYASQPDEIPTVGLVFGIFTTEDMREELVYEMTRAIASNQPYLQTVHVGFRTWNPREMAESAGVPCHPGAARFYREQGWTP